MRIVDYITKKLETEGKVLMRDEDQVVALPATTIVDLPRLDVVDALTIFPEQEVLSAIRS